jgi:NAD(P)-dependent dehydrogenase (short-subunit alcohol dehydrogenase family)
VVVELTGKVAVVTGAGSGIGRACAVALGAAGASVVVNDLDPAGLDETVAEVESAGGAAVLSVGDVRLASDVRALVALATSTFGGVDVMVANAAVSIYTGLAEQDEETIDLVLDTNLKGALLCAQAAIAPMRKRGGGSIVFLSSVQGYLTLPGCVPYAAAKAGVVAAARALAVEVGANGIRVNAVAPGTIDTPMLRRDLSGMNVEEADSFLERVRSANALKRIGTPQEIANVVLFLASPAASYVTGTSIIADGGYLSVKTF